MFVQGILRVKSAALVSSGHLVVFDCQYSKNFDEVVSIFSMSCRYEIIWSSLTNLISGSLFIFCGITFDSARKYPNVEEIKLGFH